MICVNKAFVDATAISGPAWVYKTASDSRGIVELFVLQIANTLPPAAFACRTAIKVSIVSPDWEIAIIKVLGSIIGSRYLNSLAISTSTGIFAHFSIAYFATIPA